MTILRDVARTITTQKITLFCIFSFSWFVFLSNALAATTPLELFNPQFGGICLDKQGNLTLIDSARQVVISFGDLDFSWSPLKAQVKSGEIDAAGNLRVYYTLQYYPSTQSQGDSKDNAIDTEDLSVTLVARLTDKGVSCDYRLSVPQSIKTGGLGQNFNLAAGTSVADIYKAGIWQRHLKGGVPDEVRDIYIKPFCGKNAKVYLTIAGNHYWSRNRRVHLPLRNEQSVDENTVDSNAENSALTDANETAKLVAAEIANPVDADAAVAAATVIDKKVVTDADPDITKDSASQVFLGHYDFYLFPADISDYAAAATIRGRPLALQLSTDRYGNIFADGKANFNLTVVNSSGNALTGVVQTVVAYDYDGNQVLNEVKNIDLSVRESVTENFILPAADRAIYFVEAAFVYEGVEYFARTNVVNLPPHNYQYPEQSRLGIARYFITNPQERDQVFTLLKRLGVRYLRSDDNSFTEAMGIVSFSHQNHKPEIYQVEKHRDFLLRIVEQLEKQRNPCLEFGNEWSSRQTWERKLELAEIAKSWLIAFRDEFTKRNLTIQLTCPAIGGAGDVQFLQALFDVGAWPLIDAIAFHPGRGFWTADQRGGGWRYLGTIESMRKKMRELGDKPLHLTEIYACTKPNNSWRDSYRQAADATLLSLVLGYAEDVASMHFFELHHGIGYDQFGVDPDDEYYFGLTMRDKSAKPSLLAYATAAEALDGAEFIRYFYIAGTKIQGQEFTTPRGNMAVIYDRSSGFAHPFVLDKSPDFIHSEAWVDIDAKIKHQFTTRSNTITIVDVIGRSRQVRANDNKVELTLSAAPLIVYGLQLDDSVQ